MGLRPGVSTWSSPPSAGTRMPQTLLPSPVGRHRLHRGSARSPFSRQQGQPPQHTDQEKSSHKTSPSPETVQPRSKESAGKGRTVTAPGLRAGRSPEFSTLAVPLNRRSGVCTNGRTGCPGGPEWGPQRGTGGKEAGKGHREPHRRGGWGSEASSRRSTAADAGSDQSPALSQLGAPTRRWSH